MHVCSKSIWFAWAHDKKTVLLNCWSKWMKSTAFRRMRYAEFILVVVHVCSAIVVTNSMHNCSDRRSNAVPWDRQRIVMRQRPIALEWRIWPDAMPTCVCCHHFRLLTCPSDRLDPVRMMGRPALLPNDLRLVSVAAHEHYLQFYWRNPFVCAVSFCYKSKNGKKKIKLINSSISSSTNTVRVVNWSEWLWHIDTMTQTPFSNYIMILYGYGWCERTRLICS